MNAARQRERRGLGYLLSRVFPPVYQVKGFYGDGRSHSLPYYYATRLRSWFGKERREELNRQVKAVMTSDQNYLDQAEKLFRMLEL